MARTLSGYAVFDLDGTLADSLGDISRALGRVLGRHGRRVVSDEVTGKPKDYRDWETI